MKNLVLCIFLPFSLSIHAQNKKPSWSAAKPEKQKILKRNIDIVDEFKANKGGLIIDRESLFSDENDETDDSEKLSNKIEQAKIAANTKRALERQNLVNQKIEQEQRERVATENAEQEWIAVEKIEQERITTEQAEQERIVAEKAEQEWIASENAKQEQIAAAQERITIEETIFQQVQQVPENDATDTSELPVYTWTKTKYVAPKYPIKAERSNKEGWVEIELEIDPNGNVVEAKVITTFRNMKIFNKAAIAAVKQWQFEPPLDFGIHNNQKKIVQLVFKL